MGDPRLYAEGRTCGACSLCCRTMAIEELAKPRGVWCEHANPKASAGACGIYETRPPSCSAFSCLWLSGALPEEFKPSKIGLVLMPPVVTDNQLRRVPDPGVRGATAVLLLAHEGHENAADHDRAGAFWAHAARVGVAVALATPAGRVREIRYPSGARVAFAGKVETTLEAALGIEHPDPPPISGGTAGTGPTRVSGS